jgi:putative transposase
MLRGYRIRLYPNAAQAELLDRHFGCCRWVYNNMIVINQKRYHRTGKGMSGYDMQNVLPKLKKQYPWLTEVNSQSLQMVCHNLAEGYNRFFKKKGGYPAFKKKGGKDSFSCINNSRFVDRKLKLPKLGALRFRGGDMPEGKVRRFTISEEAGKYYASALIDTPQQESKPRAPKAILGLDVGLIDAVVTSAGQSFKAPKHLGKAQSQLRKLQKTLSRRKKGSARRAKAKLTLAICHQKIRNKRKDFNHKVSKILAENGENQAFGVESLNVSGMMKNHKLARSIADYGWHQFKTFLTYKAAAVGKQVIEVGRFFPSTKTCSACGIVRQSLPLSVREWQCSDCGTMHDRDVNAAINIAQEAARNVVSERGGRVRPVAIRASASETRKDAAR